MIHHWITDFTALEPPRDVLSVELKQFHVGTISRQFQRLPPVKMTDSINHMSLAFEICAKIKIPLTSFRNLDRKYLLDN